ncbi:hypothetical protein BG006_009597 [Podila minutissima]|uniref:Transmembrane protein n=1 Tax=Podila minutissima TaxID=64525 RepID=A0A9P5SEV6_9FUNG|nr:hypothetical protein BG006_009597 [Podila minutissima]
MRCGYNGDDYECNEAGNRLYSGLTLGQLIGVIFGYLALFGLLARHYRKSSAARKLMVMKMEKMECDLARLESIHVILEALPQLLEQRLHGSNCPPFLQSPTNNEAGSILRSPHIESSTLRANSTHSNESSPAPAASHPLSGTGTRLWTASTSNRL